MTVGGWPLTGKVHIGDDYSLAYWSCFAGVCRQPGTSSGHYSKQRMVALKPVQAVMLTGWLPRDKIDTCASAMDQTQSLGVIRSRAGVRPERRIFAHPSLCRKARAPRADQPFGRVVHGPRGRKPAAPNRAAWGGCRLTPRSQPRIPAPAGRGSMGLEPGQITGDSSTAGPARRGSRRCGPAPTSSPSSQPR